MESDSVTFVLPSQDPEYSQIWDVDSKKRRMSIGEVKDLKFKIIQINEEGDLIHLLIGKKELLTSHFPSQVQLRDLRMVTTQQSQRQISSVVTRKNAIILKLEYLKAVICPRYVYIFDAEEVHVRDFADILKRRISNNKNKEETSVPQDPFEFCVLEAMLEHVSYSFEDRLHVLDFPPIS